MKNNNDVYINQTSIFEYNNTDFFNASSEYPEGLNINIKSDKKIYDEVRNLLKNMGLDKKNFGTKKWNPFGDFIKLNNNVVIKPNLVKHINKSVGENTDCLITNFAIIRPVIDYTIIALKKTGSIIIGDAPVQECDFNKVIELNGLKDGINDYVKNGYKIKLIDFRELENTNTNSLVVDLNRDSEFVDVDSMHKKYAITNYNLKLMHEHHNYNKHEYLISKSILSADVIINLPKPKTHRKAGMTACLKNFIGVNAKKDYIPHHRNGNVKSGGDEFPEQSIIKNFESHIKNYAYKKSFLVTISRKVLRKIIRLTNKNKYMEGSWYGNDTIWRSILDINKIVLYSDKYGKINDTRQRIVFNLADMIISGEKEGPLLPSRKKVGMLICSFNSLNMDSIVCQIMGFSPTKIKYIENGFKLKKYMISENKKFSTYEGTTKIKNIKKYNKKFIPTEGWKEFLEERSDK